MIETIADARDVLHKARLSASLHRDAKLDEQLAALAEFLTGAETCNLLRAYNARLLGELQALGAAEEKRGKGRGRKRSSGK